VSADEHFIGLVPERRKEMDAIRFLKWVMVALFVISAVMCIVTNKARGENASPDATYQMFLGDRSDQVILDKIGREEVVFDFPWVKIETTYRDIKLSFRNGEPFAESVVRSKDHINYWMSGFVFFIAGVIGFIGVAWLVHFAKKLKRSIQIFREWANW